jgi:D-alanine-D-alanine ligase
VLLIFGGRSAEHDVSRATAVSVARALDPDRYEIVPVAITVDGRWLFADEAHRAIEAGPAALPKAFEVAGEPVSDLGDLVARGEQALARTARTAPCRVFSNWPDCRTSAPAWSAPPSGWTR